MRETQTKIWRKIERELKTKRICSADSKRRERKERTESSKGKQRAKARMRNTDEGGERVSESECRANSESRRYRCLGRKAERRDNSLSLALTFSPFLITFVSFSLFVCLSVLLFCLSVSCLVSVCRLSRLSVV